MRLGLAQIMDRPGAVVPFSCSVDLSDLQYGASYPVTEPVEASGTVRNTAGVLVMSGSIKTCLHGVCDRCAAEFTREVEYPIQAVLVEELANELPYTTEILLNKLQKGELSFRLEHHGLLPLRETLRIAFNRLAYAVVLAALIIGSSLIVLAKEPPLWSGIPVIGIVGFVASALMGFGMLFRAIHKPPES